MPVRSTPNLALTYLDDGLTDGAGSQLLRVYGIYALARSLGIPYVHSPIAHLDYHGLAALEKNAPTTHLVHDINRVFDIPSDICLPDKRVVHNMVDADVDGIETIRRQANDSDAFHLIRVLHPYPVMDAHPELYRAIRAVSPFHYRRAEVFRLAIHVRRGELFAVYSDWMLPNSYFVSCILRFQRALTKLEIPFVCELFTEVASTTFEVTPDHHGIMGKIPNTITFTPEMNHLEDFDRIPNLERCVNLDTVETMRRMATADALILSHSSFSYLPALFHADGVVVYHPYWRSPMQEWLVSDDEGAFPDDELLTRLETWRRAPGAGAPVAEASRRPPRTGPPPATHVAAPINLVLDLEPLLRPFVEQSAPLRSIVAYRCRDLTAASPAEDAWDAVALRIDHGDTNGAVVGDSDVIAPLPYRSGAEWTSILEGLARQARERFGHLAGDDVLVLPADELHRHMPRIGDDFGFRAVIVLTARSPDAPVDASAWKLRRSLFDRGLICIGSVTVGGRDALSFLASDAVRSFNRLHVESRGRVTMRTFAEGAGYGNLLWRYAFMKLYALRHGVTPALPDWDGNELFGLEDASCAGLDLPRLDYPGFSDNDRDLWYAEDPPTERDLRGFFQEIPECWRPHRQFLRHLFQLSPDRVRVVDAWRHEVTDGGRRPLVAISVRRGDYRTLELTGLPYFRLVPEAWYLDWLRGLWPTLYDPVLFVATDEPETVTPLFQEFDPIPAAFRSSAHDFPHHLSDFEVLRRADYLALCNSSFPRMAAVLAPTVQRCFLPNFATKKVEPYQPWIDPAFWARFADAPSQAAAANSHSAEPTVALGGSEPVRDVLQAITLPPGRFLPVGRDTTPPGVDETDNEPSTNLICISGWCTPEVAGVRAAQPNAKLRFRADAPVGSTIHLLLRLAASGRDSHVRVRSGSGAETDVSLVVGSERLAALSCSVEPEGLVTAELLTTSGALWMLRGILYVDPRGV